MLGGSNRCRPRNTTELQGCCDRARKLRSFGPDCRSSRVPASANRCRNFSDFCKAECNSAGWLRVSCLCQPISRIALTVAKRPVLFADFNQTNERILPAQAETLVQSVCDCFVKGTFLIHGSPSIERDLDENAIFRSLNAQ